MAKAVQKIKLSSSRDIPFNKLVLSQSNVRRIKAGISIEDLAEDIARRTLLQSLNVRPVLDAEGQETGMFEVPAGGRRYRALELLVKQKRLVRTAPVPCVVRDADADVSAEEDSLAENVQRAALHPLDQFRAFQTFREQGQSDEDIAARFFVSVNVVKQRLRLASVAPSLLDVYAEDGMTLEQLMAFTVTGDHARQEQVWETVSKSGNDEAYQIRRMLTESTVRASDRRAQFVGVEAYEAAGGTVLRDLFESDDGGWLQDVPLLERLVTDKLKTEAETIAAEGWKWIDVAICFPYGHDHGMRELAGVPADLTADEQSTYDALRSEYATLEAKYQDADELPDEVDVRLGEIEEAIAAFENRPHVFDPAEIVHAGAFVSIDSEGELLVERGYVRDEDEAAYRAALVEPESGEEGDDDDGRVEGGEPGSAPRAVITVGRGQPEADDDEDDGIKPLPDRLVMELTAHRTLALRDALANNPHVAMTALLHKLCTDAFFTAYVPGCIEAAVRHVQLPAQAPGLKDSASATSIDERHKAWSADMPDDEAALWDWLAALDEASRTTLLAHCVSFGVNALFEKVDRYDGNGVSSHGLRRRLDQADRLVRAVNLNMVEAGWRPTVENYLGRVTKSRILEAVREAKGESSAQLIDHLKKGEMAKEAERLLDDTGWLPEPLRPAETTSESNDSGTAADPLPEFLTDDGEESDETAEDEHAHAVAAE
ncbi:ParB family chromosome partitioning protein [Afipia massiliensis]|uniref:ParB family chromosome partitioning protein n=1 Tax=Afipia massiliensis TaxID=211460 RepID=A0A840MYQ5_9BRAD|nr:ParB/RepB/Spo0J family partition protein [Afipia massiliensis]MBB5051880.1 ParB family chromosome partitioning protein [Afipia massiliensis]